MPKFYTSHIKSQILSMSSLSLLRYFLGKIMLWDSPKLKRNFGMSYGVRLSHEYGGRRITSFSTSNE